MKIGVILDRSMLARWQAKALLSVADECAFVIYNCTSPTPARRRLRHAFYYILNLLTVRNRMTRKVSLPAGLNVTCIRTFSASSRGAWQSLPPALLETIARDQPDILIKFGMGLLRVPDRGQLAVPILSYHHGEPAKFRGRPAGFYELLNGERTIGQVVQVLSNEIDSGKVVAAAETEAIPHSYRATLINAYRHSPLLLRKAIRNAISNQGVCSPTLGPAYRLPSNATVLRFLAERIGQTILRAAYGLTREKRWSVAVAPADAAGSIETLTRNLSETTTWKIVKRPSGYRFLADPFFHPEGGILVEGMNAASGRGEILHLRDDSCRRLSGRGGHFSYPSVIRSDGCQFVVPEISDWSPPQAYPLLDGLVGDPVELQVPGLPRLLDPTPFAHERAIYLFGNLATEGSSVLRLWVADSLYSQFVEHPASPIRISPNGARMGGTPLILNGQIIRVGQDLRRRYGDGISFFRVCQIDLRDYEEELIGEFRFADRRGPHTFNLANGQRLFDYYEDAFSLLAGFRRFKERRAASRVDD